jgi:hypothetical protein
VQVRNNSEYDALAGSLIMISPDTKPLKAWGVLTHAVAAQHSVRLRYGTTDSFICTKWNWLTGVCSASAPEAGTGDCGMGCSGGWESDAIVLTEDVPAGETVTISLAQIARPGCGMLPRRFGVIALWKNRRKVSS